MISALNTFRIFSNLFDSYCVGTTIPNEWTAVAVLIKVVLIFLHLKWLDLAENFHCFLSRISNEM